MFRFIVIWSVLFLMPLFAMEEVPPEILVFLGNPGAGKSTICNALKGELVFPAGFSIGTGLTKVFASTEHTHEHANKKTQYLLFDTPGLSDIKTRKEAAMEIEKALKQGGKYKLFFVITLEAGRTQSSDLTSIDLIMDSIKVDGITYNIIINKVTPLVKKRLQRVGIAELLTSLKLKTESVCYIDLDLNLVDADNAFLKVSSDLEKFIYVDSNAMLINKFQVCKIESDDFQALKEKHDDRLKKLEVKTEVDQDKTTHVINHNENVEKHRPCIVQ